MSGGISKLGGGSQRYKFSLNPINKKSALRKTLLGEIQVMPLYPAAGSG
jgi:hypothetical protein